MPRSASSGRMRAAAVVTLALVLVVPGLATVAAHHTPTHPILHRTGVGPAWTLDSFTAPRDLIEFSLGIGHDGEFAAQLLHLYNAQGTLITGFIQTYEAGRDPDLVVTAGDLTVEREILASDDASYPIVRISLRCSTACSASRDFRALVVSAGDLDQWGYAVFSPTAVAGSATRNGTGVGAVPTTAFDGAATADATFQDSGVVAAVQATRSVTTTDGFVGAFGKPSILPSASATAQTPAGAKTCFCVFRDDAPGTYSFAYTDVDALATPGVLVWADVDL